MARTTRTFWAKLREKVAILLGDTPGWLREFLGKPNPTDEECEQNRVAARVHLAKRIGEIYDKRSEFVHPDTEGEVTEEDLRFATMIFRFCLERLLKLYKEKGITRISKANTIDSQSLDSFIESLKYSVRLG